MEWVNLRLQMIPMIQGAACTSEIIESSLGVENPIDLLRTPKKECEQAIQLHCAALS